MNVFRLEFRSGRKGILIWALIMAAVIGIFMCVFPSMSGEAMGEVMENALQAMPQEMLEAFNLTDMPDFSQIEEYFAYGLGLWSGKKVMEPLNSFMPSR